MYMYRYVHIYIPKLKHTHNAPRFLNKPKYNWFFKKWFACQQRVLKRFHGPRYLCFEDWVI